MLTPCIDLPDAPPELPLAPLVGAEDGKLTEVPLPFPPAEPEEPAAPKAPPAPPLPPDPALLEPDPPLPVFLFYCLYP